MKEVPQEGMQNVPKEGVRQAKKKQCQPDEKNLRKRGA